jgi:hypothetical protein
LIGSKTIAGRRAPIYGSRSASAACQHHHRRRTFDGVRLDAHTCISERGDGREYRLGRLAGTTLVVSWQRHARV